jgi:hypothetical protein
VIYGPRQCIGNFDLKLDRAHQYLSATVPVSSILAGRNCTLTEDEIEALRRQKMDAPKSGRDPTGRSHLRRQATSTCEVCCSVAGRRSGGGQTG